jgi:hypothetical protein
MSSSYAMIVRDELLARAKSMPFFNGFKFSTNKAEQIQKESIPFVGVYFMNEDLMPEGDADTGEPRFHSTALYGFSIIVQNNDAAAAENTLDDAWVLLTDRLFTDPTLYLNPRAQIQSYTRGNRSHQFGSVGADNAIPVAECRFTLSCDLGVIDFPPVVDDVFATLHIETVFPIGGTVDQTQQVQQVIGEWYFPVEKEKTDESTSKG